MVDGKVTGVELPPELAEGIEWPKLRKQTSKKKLEDEGVNQAVKAISEGKTIVIGETNEEGWGVYDNHCNKED